MNILYLPDHNALPIQITMLQPETSNTQGIPRVLYASFNCNLSHENIFSKADQNRDGSSLFNFRWAEERRLIKEGLEESTANRHLRCVIAANQA